MTGALAAKHVSAARSASSQLKAHLEALDFAAARADLTRLQDASGSARARTHDPIWAAAAHLPLLGDAATTIRGLAQTGDDLAQGPLADALDVAERLAPAKIRPAADRVDVAALRAAAPEASRAADGVDAALTRLRALPARTRLGVLDRAREQLITTVNDSRGQLRNLAVATQVTPGLLGADGRRTYFVVFQNNAEIRGTGGLPGSFGILEADKGRLALTRVGSDGDIRTKPVDVDLGADFSDRYEAFGSRALFVNANITPHFPSAARIWQAMWEQTSGVQVDGVMALDPVVQSYLMRATGPVTAGGRTLTANNFVPYVESRIYADYPNVPRRKVELATLAGASFDAILHAPQGSSRALVDGLRRGAKERRVFIWSSHAEEQRLLEPTVVGGALPMTKAPYAQLVLNNAAGSKLDYYVSADLTFSGGDCRGGWRSTKATITVRNAAPPSGLPSYVTIRADNSRSKQESAERLLVSFYATADAELAGVRIDGQPGTAAIEAERSHPVYTIDVEIPPQGERVIELDLDEPVTAGEPTVLVPQTVRASRATLALPAC